MRQFAWRGPARYRLKWAFATLALVSAAIEPATAAGIFPTDQALVPLAVGTAFALPALLAGAWAMLNGIRRRIGYLGSGLALLVVTVAVTGLLQPLLLSGPLP